MKEKASFSHGEKLFSSLTDVEDRFVEEAWEPLEKRAKSGGWAVRMVTACLCLALGAGVLAAALVAFRPEIFTRGQPEASQRLVCCESAKGSAPGLENSRAESLEPGHRWPVKVITRDPENALAEPLLAAIPHWDELEIYWQYSTIPLDGIFYGSTGAQVPEDRLGRELGNVTAEGQDQYAVMAGEDGTRTLGAEVREISGISQNCAIAVRYDGTEEWYSAQNREYDPQTLGILVEEMGLKEELDVGPVYYSYYPNGEFANVQFEVDGERVLQLLLSAPEAENGFDQSADPHEWPETQLDISVSVPLLGIDNVALEIQEGGYLWTNLVSTGARYYVGEETTQAFVDYVLNQCEGYEYRYVFPEQSQDREPEDSSAVSYVATPEGLVPADQFGSESQVAASAPAENP